ncbi:LOW QUALITY PROTEIN: zinc finger protein 316-like [Portunus trituberculatus]|uniref:LOW QUALITY PROTEIN: zinc finger protein 316-like n=1 Tax=Portunus trituberculatus TaxID=210409 RepID=UPI001E1CB272|nr:LOW QUALITY PROTEIN: zinc finger protein 316-like [Portunus trituberculatus]
MARAKKKVTCQDCDRTFGRKGELQQHRREEHSRRNMCPICKRGFESEKRLKMHSQFHNVDGEYKCFYCPKRFNKAWKMKIHLVNHSGRPSYVCEFCGDDFLYPGKIVAHLKHVHDVCYACKDCGRAIPIEYSHRPHKCKIYGCKDCLMAYATVQELALHTADLHRDQCSSSAATPHGEAPSSPLPRAPSHDPFQGASPTSGDTEEDDECDRLSVTWWWWRRRWVMVVVPRGRLRAAGARVSGAAQQASPTSPFHQQGSDSSWRGSPSPNVREGPCSAVPRLPRDVLVSPSPPGTPARCPEDGGLRDTSELTLVVQGHRAPPNTSVIKSEEEEDEEEEEEEEDEEEENLPPSYISSVLLRSPTSGLGGRFKVPESSPGLWKKVESPAARSLRRKQDELDRVGRRGDLLDTLHRYADTDARLTQRCQTSFESWLASDSFSAPDHDYVFGFEASVSVGRRRDDHLRHHHYHHHHHYFNKKLPAKEKVDMTFEDLCLF